MSKLDSVVLRFHQAKVALVGVSFTLFILRVFFSESA